MDIQKTMQQIASDMNPRELLAEQRRIRERIHQITNAIGRAILKSGTVNLADVAHAKDEAARLQEQIDRIDVVLIQQRGRVRQPLAVSEGACPVFGRLRQIAEGVRLVALSKPNILRLRAEFQDLLSELDRAGELTDAIKAMWPAASNHWEATRTETPEARDARRNHEFEVAERDYGSSPQTGTYFNQPIDPGTRAPQTRRPRPQRVQRDRISRPPTKVAPPLEMKLPVPVVTLDAGSDRPRVMLNDEMERRAQATMSWAPWARRARQRSRRYEGFH